MLLGASYEVLGGPRRSWEVLGSPGEHQRRSQDTSRLLELGWLQAGLACLGWLPMVLMASRFLGLLWLDFDLILS